ncbi:TPA: site-specific DNA-methyltransferase [Bacillus toyonensis]
MQKLEGKTFNVVQDNIEKLKELFPEVLTENKIDIDKLRIALGENLEKGKERYEFIWNGKTDAIQLAQKQTTGTLRPSIEESVNWDTTQNLYIEGDNLEVLRILQNSYRNKVKMIYIDPPYNTGNDFIYEDNFTDNLTNYKEKVNENMNSNPETNGRFHTDWLNMIYPRLKIARNLLSEDGIILISIDNNEVNNLRKICDEIFGEENFIEQIIWKNKYGSGAKTKGFIEVHEYILCYSKTALQNITSELGESERAKYVKKDEKFEIRGGYRTQPLMTKSLGDRPNLVYPVHYNGQEIWPDKQWVWSKERMEKSIEENLVEFKQKTDGTFTIESKAYLKDAEGNMRRGKPLSLFNGPFNQDGTQEIKELFDGKTPFDFVKPTQLIKYLLSLEINEQPDKEFIVLDFFSGSSTTAQAVMELNAEDNGNRRFIMVQIPEKIEEKTQGYKLGYKRITDIGKERIRRAGQNIISKQKDNDHPLDIGFKLFKLDETNLKLWDEETLHVEQMTIDMINPIKEGRTQADVVYEILLKYGIDLTIPIETTEIAGKTLYSVGMGYLLICLENDLTLEQIEEMAKQQPARIVFYDEGFKDDTVRTNAQQILMRHGVEDIRVI